MRQRSPRLPEAREHWAAGNYPSAAMLAEQTPIHPQPYRQTTLMFVEDISTE